MIVFFYYYKFNFFLHLIRGKGNGFYITTFPKLQIKSGDAYKII